MRCHQRHRGASYSSTQRPHHVHRSGQTGLGTQDGCTSQENLGPVSNVSPGHPRGTPSDATFVKFANVICDAGMPYALKGACTVWRGTDEKVPERATRQPSTLRLITLGIDTNHGYAKTEVVNSEVAKQRTALEQKRSTLERWPQGARKREDQASQRYHRLHEQTKAHAQALYRVINDRQCELEVQDVPEYLLRREIREMKATADADIKERQARMWRAYEQSNQEANKVERYCRKLREVLRALEDLAAHERTMYELDHAKDQVMTVCKVALANLVMWTRDRYFPATYAQATWKRLAPFFQLAGRVTWESETVRVELRPFNDTQLNRDLNALCTRVATAQPRLPDGRLVVQILTEMMGRPHSENQQSSIRKPWLCIRFPFAEST